MLVTQGMIEDYFAGRGLNADEFKATREFLVWRALKEIYNSLLDSDNGSINMAFKAWEFLKKETHDMLDELYNYTCPYCGGDVKVICTVCGEDIT